MENDEMLAIIQIDDGVAEIVKAIEGANIVIIDFDVNENGECAGCGEDIDHDKNPDGLCDECLKKYGEYFGFDMPYKEEE